MRVYSSVDYDADKKTCSVTAARAQPSSAIVDEAAKKALLGTATFQAPLQKRGAARPGARQRAATSTSTGNAAETEKTSGCSSAPRGR